jgi:hypothetical protein
LYRRYIAVGQPLRRPLQDPVAASADLELHVRLVDFDEVKQTWDMSVDERLSTAIEVRACACKRARAPRVYVCVCVRACDVRVGVHLRACVQVHHARYAADLLAARRQRQWRWLIARYNAAWTHRCNRAAMRCNAVQYAAAG